MYYNYVDAIIAIDQQYPSNGDKFFHPKGLDDTKQEQLKKYGWNIRFGANGKTGFKIRIEKDQSFTENTFSND